MDKLKSAIEMAESLMTKLSSEPCQVCKPAEMTYWNVILDLILEEFEKIYCQFKHKKRGGNRNVKCCTM